MNFNPNEDTRFNQHIPTVFWFTGLPGSGKTTIAKLLFERLREFKICTALLDGDDVRSGLNRDLGFSDDDRVENMRRVTEIAQLMLESDLSVIVSLISPFENDRNRARSKFCDANFLEIFIDAPIEVCIQRDPKGHYARAQLGEIKLFTGIDSRFDVPKNPEIHIDTTTLSAANAADKILNHLRFAGSEVPVNR